MSLLSILLFGICVAFAQRMAAISIWGTPIFTRGFHGDASVHLAIVRHLRKRSGTRFLPQYLISPKPMCYPTAFHRFVNFFPLEVVVRRPWLPNLVLAILAAPLLVAMVVSFHEVMNQPAMGSLASAVALAVFLAAPTQWIFTGPGIAYIYLSERMLARLACSLAYASLVGASLFHSAALGSVGAIAAAVAILSSVFARQALFFGVPLLSLVLLDWRPVAWLAAGVLGALLVGGKALIDGLRDTVLTWKLYRTHTKKSATVRTALTGYFNWNLGDRPNWKAVVMNLWEKDPTRVLFWYPETVLATALALITGGKLGGLLLLSMIPPFVIYLVTLTERFNHLGEAYRYLEYTLSLWAPLCAGLLFAPGSSSYAALAAYLAACCVLAGARYLLQVRMLRKMPALSDELSEFLDQLDLPDRVVVFPVSMRLGADIIARRPEWKSFWWQPGIISTGIYDEFIEEYPFLKRDWQPLARRYGVTHVICDKKALAQIGWTYDFACAELILEDDYYIAYRAPWTHDGTAARS